MDVAGGRRSRATSCPKDADQYNSLHERLIEGWKVIGQGAASPASRRRDATIAEDAGTLAYIEDCARQAGLADHSASTWSEIGRRRTGAFVDLDNRPIELMFKLYPWEWMMRETFGPRCPAPPTQFVEPPWKAILSNKGILPLLWAMFPSHPNLLPAYFEDDEKAAELGNSYARKPLYSREGANVELIVGGKPVDRDEGPYGAEGFIRQAVAPLPQFDGNHAVLGSWIRRRRALRAIGARGRKPDHQEHVALPAASGGTPHLHVRQSVIRLSEISTLHLAARAQCHFRRNGGVLQPGRRSEPRHHRPS